MSKSGLLPRRAALALVTGVTRDHRLMAELLPDAVAELGGPDRARAQRLATETLRHASRADRLLGRFLRHRPDEVVHNALRLGIYEIYVDGASPHGVVDAYVELIRTTRETMRQAGLVNAVLRNVLRAAPVWNDLPPPQLPKWLRKPLLADFGKSVVGAIEAAHARGAPLDLTPAGGDAERLAKSLEGRVLPTGSVRLHVPGQVSALAGYDSGDWWVQDAAAALPARILDAAAGERVLDMCAAPGGKTMQLAAQRARVTALDISAARMARVTDNLARTGLHAETVVADALTWNGERGFDAVLLDAPCSGTGTIRRHPDLPHAKTGEDFPALFDLQRRLLDHALDLVRPGGRLVYCTCSLLIDEGEEQIRDALARHPEISLDSGALLVAGVDKGWLGPEGLRLRPDYWPECGGMDGFFIAYLRKPA